ncbi:IS66 family insertion sequence element accessory protein TnpA [Psychromonas antarctica]|uniref:IS66 family insertion sequence element accessory protein TnpA n=1 Tax=Psychromonas antarctica TaxID=67573 RepID=UPI001EE805AD|nr:hypothetical protein [Psychromonas antarctica]MCG6202820.1 hypothetical protein [Psychromonas antarctica]
MKIAPLTQIQQDWLHHINQAAMLSVSMSAYAKQNKLALPAFYHARSVLIKKGELQKSPHPSLVSVNAPIRTTSCRITLSNGVIVELDDVDISDLLNSASRL